MRANDFKREKESAVARYTASTRDRFARLSINSVACYKYTPPRASPSVVASLSRRSGSFVTGGTVRTIESLETIPGLRNAEAARRLHVDHS